MLLRRADPGFTVYLARRSAASRFMPGAYVFPGGAVDPDDGEPAATDRVVGDVWGIGRGFVVAALRELFEEAGVLIACRRDGERASIPPETLRDMRRALALRKPFVALLADDELYLDARDLIYYSNWVTPADEPLRFDAHFFVAHPPEGQIAEADYVEMHDGRWMTPGDALAAADRGELAIMFPTRKHLERLASFATLEEFLAHARARRQIAAVTPVHHPDGTLAFERGDESW